MEQLFGKEPSDRREKLCDCFRFPLQIASKFLPRRWRFYLERNTERRRYPSFRRQHLFVGSGVIEAGCKTVVGSGLKQSGMFWTVREANTIVALRCCHLSEHFEDYWEARRAA